MLYLDTSALLKLYLHEAGSEFVNTTVTSQDFPLPVWELQEMELLNALQLKVFWKDLDQKDADHQLELFHLRKAKGQYFFPEVDRPRLQGDFKTLAKHTPTLGCRTLDILHVACALQLNVTHFLSFDHRQLELASLAGLTVLKHP